MERLYEIASKSEVCDVEVKLLTPTYLRALSVPKAILVHKKSKFPRVSVPTQNLELEDSFTDTGEELNLTGAPLECPFEFDDSTSTNSASLIPRHWQKDEMLHIPLTFQEASSILSGYNMDLTDNKPLIDTVWVVCDGLDLRRIVLMGSHVDVDRQWFSRSFVSLCDNVCRLDLQIFAEKAVRRHCELARMPEDEVRYEVTCTYEVFGSRNAGDDKHSPRNVEQHCSVVLEATWENTSFRRNVLRPPLEAVTTLDLLVTVGQDTSEAYPLWQQLTLLRHLADAISRGGEAAMPGVSEPGVSMCDRVRELVRTADNTPQQWSVSAADREDPGMNFADTVADIAGRGRSHVDVTHALWWLLMRCTGVKDLADCLAIVFEEVKSGHFVPYIDAENMSSVAAELTALRSSRAARLPDLTGWTPLEMLLGIGLESLEKDYLHILLASHATTFEQLHYRQEGDEGRLAWLGRMHSVVELLCATQCHLNLPSRSLYSLVAGAIEAASSSPCDGHRRNRTFALRHPVRTVDVESHMATREFSGWRLRATSESRDKRATTIVHCSSLPIFPPLLFHADGDSTENSFQDLEDGDANYFYCTELKTIANKLG